MTIVFLTEIAIYILPLLVFPELSTVCHGPLLWMVSARTQMTNSQQTESAEEASVVWYRATEKANKCTLS